MFNSDFNMISYKNDYASLKTLELKQTKEYIFNGHETIGEFDIKCESGLGFGVANLLRQTIMGALDGYAVVALKINNANNQFAVIKGIKEPVIKIILQLKRLFFKIESEELSSFVLKLHKNGAGEVYAKDFDLSSYPQVFIVNNNLHICTLDSDGVLDLSIIVAHGKGYVSSDKHKDKFTPFLPDLFFEIDTVFTPSTGCGYKVEKNTSGKDIYDLISLTISTKGDISPAIALKESASKLQNLFAMLGNAKINENQNDNQEIRTEEEEEEENPILKQKIEDLDDLPLRPKNGLINAGILTIGDLVQQNESSLMNIPHFGKMSFVDVCSFLSKYSLRLGMKKSNKGRKLFDKLYPNT
jgi:DNA-directed RNA polymerase subunit alpha